MIYVRVCVVNKRAIRVPPRYTTHLAIYRVVISLSLSLAGGISKSAFVNPHCGVTPRLPVRTTVRCASCVRYRLSYSLCCCLLAATKRLSGARVDENRSSICTLSVTRMRAHDTVRTFSLVIHRIYQLYYILYIYRRRTTTRSSSERDGPESELWKSSGTKASNPYSSSRHPLASEDVPNPSIWKVITIPASSTTTTTTTMHPRWEMRPTSPTTWEGIGCTARAARRATS
mmetsp:Transcript_10254/g.18754  ORF Transcript_10254/g.18754 Transcript_10254/m.18754 type:complete len:230 (+) Transcript_10254:907-1596(+)